MVNAIIYNDMVRVENPTKHIWQDSSVCAQTDPDAFFIEKGGSYEPARQVCSRCVVKTNCLEKAMTDEGDLSADHRFGMFGGLTPKQRHALYKLRKSTNSQELQAL